MATRSYVLPSAYDPAATEFTIATIGGNPYLQMGALDRDDAALFRSLIDGWAGFFQNGQQVAAVRITARHDATKGVQLEGLPTLTTGGEYHVRFTQARPGRDGANRRTGGMQPFGVDRMMGRRYGPMIPFNRYNTKRLLPYTGDPMTGKPSGEPMLGRLPKKREGAQDILTLLDGKEKAVENYVWGLIENRLNLLPQATATVSISGGTGDIEVEQNFAIGNLLFLRIRITTGFDSTHVIPVERITISGGAWRLMSVLLYNASDGFYASSDRNNIARVLANVTHNTDNIVFGLAGNNTRDVGDIISIIAVLDD